jgi:tetratricopeptide (TPR) repeat protein
LRRERLNAKKAASGQALIPQHICGAHAHSLMHEFEDLNHLHGVPLEFEIELLNVQGQNQYAKEPWEMNNSEKLQEAIACKEEGGNCYKTGKYQEALEKYTRSLAMLENLKNSTDFQDQKREFNKKVEAQKREKWLVEQDQMRLEKGNLKFLTQLPTDKVDEQIKFDLFDQVEELDALCRLNYAACQLKLQNYVPVIEQCTKVLESNPNNKKALFRRAQAYYFIGRDTDFALKDLTSLRKLFDTRGPNQVDESEWNELKKWESKLKLKLSEQKQREKQMYSKLF